MSRKKVRPLRCTKSPSSKKALDVPEQCCGLSLSTLTRRGSTDAYSRTTDVLQTRSPANSPTTLAYRAACAMPAIESPDWRIACGNCRKRFPPARSLHDKLCRIGDRRLAGHVAAHVERGLAVHADLCRPPDGCGGSGRAGDESPHDLVGQAPAVDGAAQRFGCRGRPARPRSPARWRSAAARSR